MVKNVEEAIKEAELKQKEAQSMACKIIDHLDSEHITSLALVKEILKNSLKEIEDLEELDQRLNQ